MLKKVEGFILNETAYSESSKILNVFTKEYGLIGIMAKGAKRIKSPFRSLATRFTYGVFNIYYKEDKLSTLVSIDVINPFVNIKKDLTLISYMTYISDLTNQVIKDNKDKEIYNIFINALLKLEYNFDPLVITNILEAKYLSYLGVELNLESCALCEHEHDIVTIDSSNGGLICKKCMTNQKVVDPKVYKLLKLFLELDIRKIEKLNLSDDLKTEINLFLSNYYDKYTGIYLKSKTFLDNIVSLNVE